MSHHVLALPPAPRPTRSGHIPLGGRSPEGRRIAVTGASLTLDGRPWFAVSGELHFSRIDPHLWDDGLAKLRGAGIDVASTYVFWNHHEEVRGRFEWLGAKDLRRFVASCGRHDLKVIVRVGPWCHGEARNGGFPDWLYGQPFELRSNDPGYLACVAALYREIAAQLRGLLWKDGGPVIGVQLENEHMHSAAPWEMTTGVSDEWVPSGRDGEDHLLALKKLAVEAGLDVPLYTATAWGGAMAPVPEVLPLWGGYAYQPWLFYGDVKEHPATPEYLFRDHHHDAVPRTYNFEPRYRPEDYPYACCEMGGGMQVYYRYRFQLPPESVEAMAVVKTAGGCNLLGYYMFHGGTHPRGVRTPFLNEHATPKRSYDYQAPIGPFGQLRDHFHRLKALHRLVAGHGEALCAAQTVLPAGAADLDPRDVRTPRFAVRAAGASGFLFLNNFQDHVETQDHEDLSFELVHGERGERLRIPASGGLTLQKGVSCVLPFNLDVDGLLLRHAVAQPLGRLERPGAPAIHLFMVPQGMRGELALAAGQVTRLETDGATVRPGAEGGLTVVEAAPGRTAVVRAAGPDGRVRTLWALTREEGLHLWTARLRGTEHLLVTAAPVLPGPDGALRIECVGNEPIALKAFPPLPPDVAVGGARLMRRPDDGPWAAYTLHPEPKACPFTVERVGPRKAALRFDDGPFSAVKALWLRVRYTGDVGNAYLDGELVADDFASGAPWDLDLTPLRAGLRQHPLVLDVIPVRRGGRVVRDTSMAGQYQLAGEELGELGALEAIPVRDAQLR